MSLADELDEYELLDNDSSSNMLPPNIKRCVKTDPLHLPAIPIICVVADLRNNATNELRE